MFWKYNVMWWFSLVWLSTFRKYKILLSQVSLVHPLQPPTVNITIGKLKAGEYEFIIKLSDLENKLLKIIKYNIKRIQDIIAQVWLNQGKLSLGRFDWLINYGYVYFGLTVNKQEPA